MSIGAVAAQTGVSAPVLRSWEQRHRFPTATRTPSGHRRYTAQDVDDIIQVLRERDSGLSLDAAIESTRHRRASRPARSLYADLRAASPHLTPHLLSKRPMLAISRAIEDGFCARAERPLLIGCFQRPDLYQRSADDGNHSPPLPPPPSSSPTSPLIARRHHDRSSSASTPTRPSGVNGRSSATRPEAAACLVGWEHNRHHSTTDNDRTFEAIWTAEPAIVRQASRIALDLITRQAPQLAVLSAHLVPLETFEPNTVLRRATDLTNRVIAYLDR